MSFLSHGPTAEALCIFKIKFQVFLSRSAVQNHQTSSRKKRAARIVNGINCTPYDVAYAGGYLSAFAFHPVYRAQIKTCLGDGIDFLSSGEWEEGKV